MKMMIKLLPIDYCGTIEELSKWHDEWSCEVFGSIDPSRYYKQAGEGGRYLYGVAEDMSLNEEKATRERVLELLLRIRSINQKLSGMSISQHLQYEEREQMKMERKTLYDEYLELVQPEPQQDFNPEPQQGKEEKTLIPTINNTDKERLVFGNALQKQYMTLNNGRYKWTLAKSLLAYMCGKLYCGDRIKEDESDYSNTYVKGNTQMPANEVKELFDGVDVASNRYSIKAPPRNSWKVDELFKSKGASR